MSKKINYYRNLRRDFILLAISIVATFILAEYGIIQWILNSTKEFGIVAAFVSGFFWTSVFTISPASLILGNLSRHLDILYLAFWGGLGAMSADLLIYYFVRDVFADDLQGVIKVSRFKKVLSLTHFSLFRWVSVFIGGLVIMSPLPDEIGLSLMGVSKMKVGYLIPLAFIFNTLGIYLLALAARALV